MKAIIQRVNSAVLVVDDQKISSIAEGMVCYLGIGKGDCEADLDWMVRKIAGLRIFADGQGKMNLSLLDCNGEIMVVSQFTLYGSLKKGFRPSFTGAEIPEAACSMYEKFCEKMKNSGVKKVARGVFAADMEILQNNCGPVTIILDSRL